MENRQRVEIILSEHSKQFVVRYKANNSKKASVSETEKTHLNAKKNIVAMMKLFGCKKIGVYDYYLLQYYEIDQKRIQTNFRPIKKKK